MSSTPVPVLPDSAPFSPAQRAWLNGFFAGMIGLVRGGEVPALNGQAGSAADAATTKGSASAGTALAAPVAPAEDEDFPWHDPALAIADRLKLADEKPFPRKLMAAMAQLDCGACGYLCQTYAEAIASGAEPDLTRCAPGGRETSKKLKELVAKGGADGSSPSIITSDAGVKKVPAATGKFDRDHPFHARLLKCIKLNGEGSAKDTRFISFDLKGSGLDYIVGDALGVFPENSIEDVEWILDAMDFSGAEDVPGTDGAPTSLLEALHRQRTISKPSDNLLELLADNAADAAEAAALREMLNGDGAPEGTEVLDLLLKYPSARPAPEQLVSALPPIQPRLYSIASSRAAHPDEVHLTVGVVRFLNCHGRQCKGVASTYMADRLRPGMKVGVFLQTSHGFRLPADPATPVIMVGPGTGIAPFRAFLEERHAAGAKGKNWLFFGDQHEAHDFLYRDELEQYHRAGTLTRFDTAFSRDSDQKLYVQHRMAEHGKELWDWLQNGAAFYVCGDAKRMAKDVDNALKAVVAKHGGMSDDAAAGYVGEMAKNKRYLRDVY
jgi:sulfite reductase (NADPH) flavoprotein alpha-component